MRIREILAGCGVAVLLAACTQPGNQEPQESETAAVTATEAPTSSSEAEPSDGGSPTEWDVSSGEGEALPGDEGPAPAEAGDEESAEAAAEKLMGAFLDKSKSTDEWWAGVSQLMTPTAQEVWQYTEPRRLPTASVTGTSVDSITATDAEVTVETDAGTYTVTLVRDAASDPWLASDIATPEEG